MPTRYEKHHDELLEYQKAYYWANREKILTQKKAQRDKQENKQGSSEEQKQYARAYYQKHRREILQHSKDKIAAKNKKIQEEQELTRQQEIQKDKEILEKHQKIIANTVNGCINDSPKKKTVTASKKASCSAASSQST
jgi:hypothetical protein